MNNLRYRPEMAELVRLLRSLGEKNEEIARLLGVTQEKLLRWQVLHPDFKKAMAEPAAAELAELLGGKVACTRPLVENNTFDAKHQIGLSGRTVKPKLIFTLGISGAVQFAAGMKSSDCIVAINSDPNAPIFDVAHYCVVGDVNLILPKLIDKIKGVS